jgi:5-dehydro-2-deoxygluconokinase
MQHRAKDGPTVLDLDYRPSFWRSPHAAHEAAQRGLSHATVAVGNLDEWEVAVGSREPALAAAAAAQLGVELAVIKLGPRGVSAYRDGEDVQVPVLPVDVVNGLGAGDAFGGALCHSLLAGWNLERAMRFCNAAGALVAGRLACADAMPEEHEVEAAMRTASDA